MSSSHNHKTRTLWLMGILHAFTHVYQIVLIPLYLLIQRGLKLESVERATLLVTVMGMAYYLPSYPLGVLADRHSRKRMLSGIYLASAVSNPVFGHLSDGGRVRWALVLLMLAALLVALFPHVPRHWMMPVLAAYGFFFMASYPVVEAALMESVPDALRGRAFGLFVMFGGLLGNLSHWAVGAFVKNLGPSAAVPSNYYPAYGAMAFLMFLSLAGLPCLHAIRKREGLAQLPAAAAPRAAALPPPHAALK